MVIKKPFTYSFFIVLFAGAAALAVRAADAPHLNTISPDNGVMGTLITLTGTNFTNNNTVDWGFGRITTHATGNPGGVQTITFRLGTDCEGEAENPCGAVPIGGEGLVTIRVTNENGPSSITAVYLLRSHPSACYSVDRSDSNNPKAIKLSTCSDPTCEYGPCIVPTPTPTPTPTPSATPTPTPTPTPSPTPSVLGTTTGNTNGNSSSTNPSANPRVAGTTSRGPSQADRNAPDFIPNASVPAVVEALYEQAYGQPITHCSSHYWKIRARSDKARRSTLLGAMLWQRQHGRNPVFRSCLQQSGNTTTASTGGKITHHDINRLFRLAHGGVNPTLAQNQYWLGRLKDKPTESAMLGAMQWHFLNNTGF